MNLNQFTVKSQEAVHRAAQLASDKQHPAIEKAHLLAALLSEKDQLLSFAFKKLGVQEPALMSGLQNLLDGMPKVSSGAGSPNLSTQAYESFKAATQSLQEFGDDYVAVDHILLGLCKGSDPLAKLLQEKGVSEKPLKVVMKEIREKQKINDPNAEAKFKALFPVLLLSSQFFIPNK